jgi:hypothetical protein
MSKWKNAVTIAVSKLVSEHTARIIVNGTEQQRRELVPALQNEARQLFMQLAQAQALLETCFRQRTEYENGIQVTINLNFETNGKSYCKSADRLSRGDEREESHGQWANCSSFVQEQLEAFTLGLDKMNMESSTQCNHVENDVIVSDAFTDYKFGEFSLNSTDNMRSSQDEIRKVSLEDLPFSSFCLNTTSSTNLSPVCHAPTVPAPGSRFERPKSPMSVLGSVISCSIPPFRPTTPNKPVSPIAPPVKRSAFSNKSPDVPTFANTRSSSDFPITPDGIGDGMKKVRIAANDPNHRLITDAETEQQQALVRKKVC